MTSPRCQVLAEVADLVDRHTHAPVTRVAIAGVDGAFHHPRAIRHRPGRDSPVWYDLDPFDYGVPSSSL